MAKTTAAASHHTGARHHRASAPRHLGATSHRHSHILQAIDLTSRLPVTPSFGADAQYATLSRSMQPARLVAGLHELGLIQSYDAGTNTALVQLAGATPNTLGPIALSKGLAPALAVAGARCMVQLLDAINPADGSIIAIW